MGNKLKLWFGLLLVAVVQLQAMGQTAPDRYWVQFTDKTNSPYSINNPEAFLSQRAIERRTKRGISIVQNDLPVNPHYIDSVRALGDIQLLHRSKWFNAITIFSTDSMAVEQIRTLSFVTQVKSVRRLKGEKTEPKPLFHSVEKHRSTSDYYSNRYGPSYNQIRMHNGHLMHDDLYKGEGMLVAICDAGFRHTDRLAMFEKLRSEERIVATHNFIHNDKNVYNFSNHGMNVLSCMAGYVPGELIGTAPEASYVLLVTEDVSFENIIEEDNWVAGAEFADSIGVDVINTSLGYSTFDDSTASHTYADLDGNTTRISIGADIAASKGILVVTSAGNAGQSPWFHITAPADADSTLTVGAVDSLGIYAPFSSKGPSADGDIKPNVVAQGRLAYVASPNGGVVRANGTSFSSPIMAGLATVLWQAHPDRSNMEIIDALQQYGNATTPDSLVGYGVPDVYLAHLALSGRLVTNPRLDQLLEVYPNPFEDVLKFVFYSSKEQTATVELFDTQGKRLFEGETTFGEQAYCNFRIDTPVDQLLQGLYVLRVTTEQGSIRRVVMQR